MSFRLFIYYCALIGGWAAFAGWALGLGAPEETFKKAAFRGLALGVMVALGLSLVDASWNLGSRQTVRIAGRVLLAMIVGGLGGLIGGILGQLLTNYNEYLLLVGWAITGLFVGFSIAAFEIFSSILRRQDIKGAARKLTKCLMGGVVGGFLGGFLLQVLRGVGSGLFSDKNPSDLLSPTALGFVVMGVCIGLLVGLAQVILKEAWVKVEQGFKAGREMILAKEATVIGRGEGCDIALFGDMGVEKVHARIIMKGSQYFLEDEKTPGGTFINEVKVTGQAPLKNGDQIRVGRSLLRFSERQKKNPK